MLGQAMEREILEQPDVLNRNLDSYARQAQDALQGQSFDMVLLVARGSSDNAALIARYWIEVAVGIPVCLAAPSVLTRFQRSIKYPKCLAIGISQSGAAPDVAEILCELRATGHTTLAITNTEGSRITQEAEHTLLLGAGQEHSVAATKTYTASLLALYQIARALQPSLPPPALPTEGWCEDARELAAKTNGIIVRSSPVFALGRGYSFGTAHETALKLMECALIPCKAYSSADFEHGPKALAGHGSAAISYDGPKPDLARQGCEILAAHKPEGPQELAPIWEIFYGQWLALLAARARALNPDDPQHIQKVTETR
jgi:glucosamine--fructose-6-phosphate aminotransferase (isomerizing)